MTRLLTRKFYKNEWNEERYFSLRSEYEQHFDLVMDLMLELTRAANLVCDLVRHHILASYRREAGRLIVRSGPDDSLKFREFVVQYSPSERAEELPYRGIEAFIADRFNRDRYFGQGQNRLDPDEIVEHYRPRPDI